MDTYVLHDTHMYMYLLYIDTYTYACMCVFICMFVFVCVSHRPRLKQRQNRSRRKRPQSKRPLLRQRWGHIYTYIYVSSCRCWSKGESTFDLSLCLSLPPLPPAPPSLWYFCVRRVPLGTSLVRVSFGIRSCKHKHIYSTHIHIYV